LFHFNRLLVNNTSTMETRKPSKTTILFIGIFLIGIILVILFINKALNSDNSLHTYQDSNYENEKVIPTNV